MREVGGALGLVELVPPEMDRRERDVRDRDVRHARPIRAAPRARSRCARGCARRRAAPDGRRRSRDSSRRRTGRSRCRTRAPGPAAAWSGSSAASLLARPELRDAEVGERERAHLDGDRAVPILAQREPGRAERLLEVAVEARAVQGGGGRGHARTGAAGPAGAARRARTPSRAARRPLRSRRPRAAGRPSRARARRRRSITSPGISLGEPRGARRPSRPRRSASQCSPMSSAASCQSAAATAWRAALERVAVGRVPAARGECRRGQLVREAVLQLGAEHLGEQRVVAEPGARRVERVDEARPRGSSSWSACRPSATPVSASASSALTRSTIEVRSRNPSVVVVVAAQDLGGQVVGHGAVVAGEAGDERARVGVALERQLGQPERRGPALGARSTASPRPRPRARAGRAARPSRLVVNARSAARISASSPATRSRCSRTRRVAAGGEHEPQRGMAAAPAATPRRRATSPVPTRVEVVEHDDQRGRRCASSAARRPASEREPRAGTARPVSSGRARDIAASTSSQNARRSECSRVERHVRDRHPGVARRGHPRAEQHGLARARGGRDQCERTVRSPVR